MARAIFGSCVVFPGAGRPGDDDHRVLVDGEGDVGDARRDGELGRKRERRRAWQLQPEERWRWARRSSSASRASVRAAMARALVVGLAPARQAEGDLDASIPEIEVQREQGEPLPQDAALEVADLRAVEEQLAHPTLGVRERASGEEGGDVHLP